MSGCAASLENASTAPGLVVWSSSVTSSTCFPNTPPDLLTRSSAILAPISAYLPLSAAGPVTGSTMPILIASPARATRQNMGAARLAASPAFTDRLLSLIRSSRSPCAWFRRTIRRAAAAFNSNLRNSFDPASPEPFRCTLLRDWERVPENGLRSPLPQILADLDNELVQWHRLERHSRRPGRRVRDGWPLRAGATVRTGAPDDRPALHRVSPSEAARPQPPDRCAPQERDQLQSLKH